MANVRNIAYHVLYRVLYEDAYSAIAINSAVREEKLSGVDVSFLSALVYGVLERKLTLEYIIRQYSSIRIKKIEKGTLIVLYLGMYQLIYMDKVPDSAAVNESVKLCKQLRLYKSAGFVNAIVKYLSVVYSCPESMVTELIATYGEDLTEQALQGILGRPPITVRVNTLKTDKATLRAALEKQNVIVNDISFLENTLNLSATGSLEKIPEFQQGHFFVEDAASQLCAEILGAQPDETIADVCAAPGGKSLYSAIRMENRGSIHAYDIHEHKIKLMEENPYVTGSSVMCRVRDGGSCGVSPKFVTKQTQILTSCRTCNTVYCV